MVFAKSNHCFNKDVVRKAEDDRVDDLGDVKNNEGNLETEPVARQRLSFKVRYEGLL